MKKKGRFYKTDKGYEDCFKLTLSELREINVSCDFPCYSGSENFKTYTNFEGVIEVSDFVNSLCFELLRTYGYEYDKVLNKLRKVIYTWDANLIPGEKFFGINIKHLIGQEESWYELIPNIDISLDILNYYRFDLNGYTGLKRCYPLYLPYTDENIELYKKYLEHNINIRYPSDSIQRKIKI